MTIRIAGALTIALCIAVATGMSAQTQEPITKTQSVTTTATVQAIDPAARTITLRDEQGNEETYVVSPEVKRLNEVKVGDTIKMTYYEAVVIQTRKPGEQPTGTAGSTEAMTRGSGALPSSTISAQDTMTVTVKAIDPTVPSITVTTPDGRTVTRKVQNRKNLEGIGVGDQLDITYTRALVTGIERNK